MIHQTGLLRAIRIVIRADSDPVRLATFLTIAATRDRRAAAFFSNGWAARFQRYDASYVRPQTTIDIDVRAAIQRLRDRVPTEAAGGR